MLKQFFRDSDHRQAQRDIAGFWRTFYEASKLPVDQPYDGIESFLRKYPNQWSDCNQELTQRIHAARKDMRKRYQESLQNCMKYFDKKLTLSREPVDMNDQNFETPAFLEHADNRIISREMGLAPAQESNKTMLIMSMTS